MEISGGIDICQMSFPTGATAILLLVCILSLLSTKCPAASILRSARFSSMQTTKKPHGYHKIAVWQKDDRIRKSPLKFCVYYYNELEGDCQASIITELWLHLLMGCRPYIRRLKQHLQPELIQSCPLHPHKQLNQK